MIPTLITALLSTALVVANPIAETGKTFGDGCRFGEAGISAMAMVVDGDRLYGGAGDELFIFDISNPFTPKQLGSVKGIGGVRQVAVHNGVACVTAREYGLWIVDVSDPAHPYIRSRFDTCELATGVDVAGNVCFCGQRQNGVEFIDITNPDRPQHIAMRKTKESQSVKYRDGWLYSGEWGGGHVTVFDAHDMRDIRQVAEIDLYGFGDGVWLQGDYLYAARGHHAKHRKVSGGLQTEEMKLFGMNVEGGGMGHGLDIFDVSNPKCPKRIGTVDYPPFYSRGLDMWTPRTSGGLLVAAQTHNGLFAVDISDNSAPKVIDRWLVPSKKRPDWPSECISSVAIGKGVVYVAVKGVGFFAVQCKNAVPAALDRGCPPTSANFREPYPVDERNWHVWRPPTAGQCRAVSVSGDIAYVACGDAGLHVLQILPDNAGFLGIARLTGHDHVYDVVAEDRRIYTAEGKDGFGVYDVSLSPVEFKEVARLPYVSPAQPLALNVWKPADGWLVCSDRHGVDVFDVSQLPRFRHGLHVGGSPGWDRYLADKAIGNGRYVAYNVAHTSVKWIDLMAGKNPRISTVTQVNRVNLRSGVCAFGKKALISTKGGYFLVNPNEGDPENGGEWAKISLNKDVIGIPRTDGRRVIFTDRIGRKASLFDLLDVYSPKLVRSWTFSGNPDLADFHKGKVIIPCGYEGLLLQKRYDYE